MSRTFLYTLRNGGVDIPATYIATNFQAERAQVSTSPWDDYKMRSFYRHPAIRRFDGRLLTLRLETTDPVLDLFAVEPIDGVLVHQGPQGSYAATSLVVLSGVTSAVYDRLHALLDAAHVAATLER